MPKELIFLVEEAEEGGYVARALGEAIFTQGETWEGLKEMVRDAVRCHYPEGEAPGSSVCISSGRRFWLHETSPGPGWGRTGKAAVPPGVPVVRQTGSHVHLTWSEGSQEHHLTIPLHRPLRWAFWRRT